MNLIDYINARRERAAKRRAAAIVEYLPEHLRRDIGLPPKDRKIRIP
ncbi:MAG: hypothetical protein AAGI03_15695 [Pseudomonadota bacterium]